MPPIAGRSLNIEAGADHSEAWGWAWRTLVVVRSGEAEVAGSLARSLAGTICGRPQQVGRKSGRCAGG